jgi:antibiotic biosynthesis monooxygenase (ABM) superfamily enzyme
VYRAWLSRIEPWVEGEPTYRSLHGLEAFFRTPLTPPRWKMALLTWLAVWPVSLLVPALLLPLIGRGLPAFLMAGIIAAGIVIVLTWVAMPLLTRAADGWLHLHDGTENRHHP